MLFPRYFIIKHLATHWAYKVDKTLIARCKRSRWELLLLQRHIVDAAGGWVRILLLEALPCHDDHPDTRALLKKMSRVCRITQTVFSVSARFYTFS
jgi:hypothetical protein